MPLKALSVLALAISLFPSPALADESNIDVDMGILKEHVDDAISAISALDKNIETGKVTTSSCMSDVHTIEATIKKAASKITSVFKTLTSSTEFKNMPRATLQMPWLANSTILEAGSSIHLVVTACAYVQKSSESKQIARDLLDTAKGMLSTSKSAIENTTKYIAKERQRVADEEKRIAEEKVAAEKVRPQPRPRAQQRQHAQPKDQVEQGKPTK